MGACTLISQDGEGLGLVFFVQEWNLALVSLKDLMCDLTVAENNERFSGLYLHYGSTR